nr:MAG TPA: hypothetical protein [Caudoviricetes sp.]
MFLSFSVMALRFIVCFAWSFGRLFLLLPCKRLLYHLITMQR